MAKFNYAGKNCLITGGSSGIGLALAKELALKNANVWILARNEEKLQSALKDIQALRQSKTQEFGYYSVDVADLQAVTTMAENFIQACQTLDILVNSAGVSHPGYVDEISPEIYRHLTEVNYLGMVYVTKAFLPTMMQRQSGAIVNISSMAGYIGTFGYTAYSGSKFAMTGFSEALRAEMKLHGIQVSVAFPPETNTPMLEYEAPLMPVETQALSEGSRRMNPDAVARGILQGMERRQFRILPGGEAKFYYRISSMFNEAMNWYADLLTAGARKNRNLKKLEDVTTKVGSA
jgi:3-dehydrosphinganine reductase